MPALLDAGTERPLVHVVDDDGGIRASLSALLQASGYAVKTWESGEMFIAELAHLMRGCIVLDLRMPGRNGLEILEALRGRGVDLPVILLTGHGDVAHAVQAMKSGAVDFLSKPVEPMALVAAVAEAYLRMNDAQRRARLSADATVALARLTVRERDILQRLAAGDPHTLVADDLGISPRTVEVHRANLIAKLRVRNLPEALKIAFAAGLTSKI